jgi:MFS transporter, AAHS family, 4-hydroxybenzoate transporter
MTPTVQIAIEDWVNRTPIGIFRSRLFLLCGICLVFDGFDVQSMGYVAPAIAADWGLSKATLGPVFSAGLLGLMLGALFFSVVADKLGRRPVIIGCTAFFSICMLITPFVHNCPELAVLRFITGLGLGAIQPNAMALAGEYSPIKIRTTVVMVISCGFTVGAALGGFVSAALVAHFGWQSVFYFGALLPLIVVILMLPFLPESPQFLVLQGHKPAAAIAWLRQIDSGTVIGDSVRLTVQEPAFRGMPITGLFQDGRATMTLLLWLVNFTNLIDLYSLSSWLPSVIRSSGLSESSAILAGATLQTGGVVGTLFLGRIIDRYGFVATMGACFLVSILTIVLTGQPSIGPVLLFFVIAISGFCIIGGQPALNAFATNYYPTSLRSTGVGWSLGIGRFGSVLGPMVGGLLIARQWSNSSLFIAAAVPALISAITILGIGLVSKSSVRRADVMVPSKRQ